MKLSEILRIPACILISPFICFMVIIGVIIGLIDFTLTGKADVWRQWFTHYCKLGGKNETK